MDSFSKQPISECHAKGILKNKYHKKRHFTNNNLYELDFTEKFPLKKHFIQFCQDCTKIVPSAAASKFVYSTTANTDQTMVPQCNGLNVYCLAKVHCIVLCALLTLSVFRKPISFLLSRDNEELRFYLNNAFPPKSLFHLSWNVLILPYIVSLFVTIPFKFNITCYQSCRDFMETFWRAEDSLKRRLYCRHKTSFLIIKHTNFILEEGRRWKKLLYIQYACIFVKRRSKRACESVWVCV